jgi:uncharacterized membrane protein (DUF2068 family)
MEQEVQRALAPSSRQGVTPPLAYANTMPEIGRGHGVVLLIGLYKLTKALVMLIVAVTALNLVHQNVVEVFDGWVLRLHLDPENRILEHQIVPHLARMTDSRLRLVGCGALAYVALYTIQGVGLMRKRRWAEWLTVVSGLGLVPVEAYGLASHPTISRALLLGGNLAIAGFLYWHVRRRALASRCFRCLTVAARQDRRYT